jgi:hypothetical protein
VKIRTSSASHCRFKCLLIIEPSPSNSGRVISPTDKLLPAKTQYSKQTYLRVPKGIRVRPHNNASDRASTAIGSDRMISKMKQDYSSVFHLLHNFPHSLHLQSRVLLKLKMCIIHSIIISNFNQYDNIRKRSERSVYLDKRVDERHKIFYDQGDANFLSELY